MEFQWNISQIFKSNISKINYTLLPSDFSGDRKDTNTCSTQVANILDVMGVASAKAQDLTNVITSADKLRNSEHLVYLMVDPNHNDGQGSVVGILKIGEKNLFLYDETGMMHEKKSLCILDFYVHESKQRTGFGKKLYDYMLYDQNIEPAKLAIDKPSVNFLSFLYKHYGLEKIFPQNNNFVVFEGFFDEKVELNGSMTSSSHPSSPNHSHGHSNHGHGGHSNHGHGHSNHGIGHANHGPGYDEQDHTTMVDSGKYIPTLYGRHTAFKPTDSMSKIIGEGANSEQSPMKSGM